MAILDQHEEVRRRTTQQCVETLLALTKQIAAEQILLNNLLSHAAVLIAHLDTLTKDP